MFLNFSSYIVNIRYPEKFLPFFHMKNMNLFIKMNLHSFFPNGLTTYKYRFYKNPLFYRGKILTLLLSHHFHYCNYSLYPVIQIQKQVKICWWEIWQIWRMDPPIQGGCSTWRWVIFAAWCQAFSWRNKTFFLFISAG